jgi:hypothetical protein
LRWENGTTAAIPKHQTAAHRWFSEFNKNATLLAGSIIRGGEKAKEGSRTIILVVSLVQAINFVSVFWCVFGGNGI